MRLKRRSSVAAAVATALATTIAHAQAPDEAATTGTIRVEHHLRAVQVDDTWVKAKNGIVVVPCGSHRVRAGMREVRALDVPCGGVVAMPGEDAEAAPPEPSVGRSSAHGFFAAHAGASVREMFSVAVVGPELSLGGGGRWKKMGLEMDLGLFYASAVGLPFWQVRLEPTIQYLPVPRVQLGIGPYLYLATIQRITTDGVISAWSFGGRITTSVDLWKLGSGVDLFAFADLAVDTTLWGPSLALGARF